MELFDSIPQSRRVGLPAGAYDLAGRAPDPARLTETFDPGVDDRLLEIVRRARNPEDPFELRDLWLGRVEDELGGHSHRPALAERWRATRVRRTAVADDVLSARSTVRFVKELFNWFFRDDVYGDLRTSTSLIMSGGAVDEQAWGLPATLKQCVAYALRRDWYGYSDSRGRVPAREAVAGYENARIVGEPYDARNVALTMGGTFAISALGDFLLLNRPRGTAPALCAIPNYPPLVETIARRHDTRLVPLPSSGGFTSVDGLIEALTPQTPLVLLQTAGNPTGAVVSRADLDRLIRAAAPTTTIILDECHEWLGPVEPFSTARAAANVVRVSSLSKTWSAPGLKVGWMLADAAFIDEYYEYASTAFGGPPSFFYTLVEMLARMERWLITGLVEPGPAELAEFERGYGLDLPRLRAAFAAYRLDRTTRDRELAVLRDAAVTGLTEASARVLEPRYSINLALTFPSWDDSYLCFRDLLRETGVSVFPGILTFCLSGATVRVTTARPWTELSAAITRLGAASTVAMRR